MRFFPILTAILVAAALFGIVMQRDTLLEFAGVSTVATETEVASDASGPGAEARRGRARR